MHACCSKRKQFMGREKTMMIPELFLCPISLDLMADPVTLLATGHTYDRRNIQRWLAAGRRTCPVTMPPDTELAPNRTLKHLIDRWLLTGRTLSVSDLALPTLTDNLRQHLAEEEDDRAVLEETLRIVRCLSPPGLCASLLLLLLRAPPSLPAPVLELALDCLVASPSKHELATALQRLLQEEEEQNTKKIIAFHLRQGSSLKVKTGICRLIQILASAGAQEQQSMVLLLLGRSEQVMAALAAALVLHASSAALRAMSSLIRLPDQPTRDTAVAAGAVDALLSYISFSSSGSSGHDTNKSLLLPLALETLELLLISVDAARQAMYANSGTATLVRMVFRVPSDEQGGSSEHAIGSLLVTCRESATVRVDAINAGLLKQLLLLLQTQCSPKAKTNATALLKLLRALWARH